MAGSASGEPITSMDNVLVTDEWFTTSVALTLNEYTPGPALALPEIAPVAESNCKPWGRPPFAEKLKVFEPPEAATLAAYEPFCNTAGRLLVVIRMRATAMW